MDRPIDRRRWMVQTLVAPGFAASILGSGCIHSAKGRSIAPDLVWGRRGISQGRFLKPRAVAIDKQDHLYIVDTTGRIQVFDADGLYIRGWTMPLTKNGRPTGLSIDYRSSGPEGDGYLLVADTHYHRVTVFDLQGQLISDRTLGGTPGRGPGEFAFVTDVVRDPQGHFYVGEYGDSDRIQMFDSSGVFVCHWGGTGHSPGQFVRPQSLFIDQNEQLWVVDACNHRIQQFDLRTVDLQRRIPPKQVANWGTYGHQPGQLYYPYDLALLSDQSVLICEYGNQRLQRFTATGQWIESWGRPGHLPGELYQPWGVVVDSKGRIHVLDSNNHRVQRLRMSV